MRPKVLNGSERASGRSAKRAPQAEYSVAIICCYQECYTECVKNVNLKAFGGLVYLFVVSIAMLFLPAWTFNYWQGWVYLAVFMISTSAIVLYLVRNDPELMARRINNKEEETSQKAIHFLVNVAFVAVTVLPVFDHRFAWSIVPVWVVILGDTLVALGMLIIFRVFKENSFTASTIQVAADQKVISTGPYALVRHPMYVGGLIFILGIPLALGSWWGLLIVALFVPVLGWRILDEEKFLVKNLRGYKEYKDQVKYRLVPFIW